MATNSPSVECSVERGGSDVETGVTDQAEQRKHGFSEPWEDSDLILVVEDEKFHVHRVIMSMNSPVFKAMFKSQFKEATSNEIPLPEKKANEVLDFLKQIYFPYIEERVEITIDNVEHLLKLSDEYQVKLIFEPCIKFVKDQSITKENVMKLLMIADLYDLADVHEGCNNLLKDMKLKTMSETVHLEELDLKNVRHFLEQRIERLETFLDTLYPQFMGLVGCLLWLLREANKSVSWCPSHVSNGKLGSYREVDKCMTTCSHCGDMLTSAVQTTCTSYFPRKYCYGGKYHFDESLLFVIKDFRKLKHG